MSQRLRDFAVLTALMIAVMLLLLAFGRLGFGSALTAMILMLTGAGVYYVSAAPVQTPPRTVVAGEAEEAESRADTRILQAVPMPVFEVDLTGRIVSSNPPARGVLGIDGASAPPMSTVIRTPSLLSAIDIANRDGADPALIVELDGDSGEVWRAHVSRPKDTRRTLVLLEDLTATRRSAKARADFLANASHELRTPLTTIMGFIETLLGPAKDDAAARERFLGLMSKEAGRMNRLIADLLSLSRIESSERSAPESREDILLIVRDCLSLIQPAAEARAVKLTLAAPDQALMTIAHRDEITQVVENLVSNAVKYSADGGEVRVRIGWAASLPEARRAAHQQWDDGERLMLLAPPARTDGAAKAVFLRVEDDGPGIASEHLPRLGERFYRADKSRGGKITGTGLGLAIVKHIMAHHRGGLGVETRAGRGSAFGIWFPAG